MNDTSLTGKNHRFTALAWVLAALVLAVAIPVNLIFDRLNINFDMTPKGMYTLTETTTKYLNELDANGTVVDVYFLNEIENIENDVTVLDFYQTLMHYNEHPCFNLIDFDPDTDPETLRKINPDGIYNLKDNDFFFVCNGNTKRVQGGKIYVQQVTETSSGETVAVSEEFCAERMFTGAMMSVVEGIVPTIYFLEGHGEHPLSDFSRLTANLANFNYACRTLNLMTETEIPDDACIIVSAGPTADLTDDEFDKLYAFTEQGGHISLLMTPNEAAVSYRNYERLMQSYCLAMDYNRIYESDNGRHKNDDPYTFMCNLMPAAPDAADDLTAELINGEKGGLLTYMPASRSFYSIYGSNYSSLSIDTLISTETTAVAEPFGGTIEDPEKVEGKELSVAMYSVDTLRNNSKLAVFGSAEFLTDAVMNDAGMKDFFVMPTYLFSATITWMQDSEIDVNIPNKETTYDTIRVGSSKEATGLLVVFIGYPLLIAVTGVIVWLRRKDA